MPLTPMDVLTEMISAGWGDMPQADIPANWRELPSPASVHRRRVIEECDPASPTNWTALMTEVYGDPKALRAEMGHSYRERPAGSLADIVMENEARRRRPHGSKTRPWKVRIQAHIERFTGYDGRGRGRAA